MKRKRERVFGDVTLPERSTQKERKEGHACFVDKKKLA